MRARVAAARGPLAGLALAAAGFATGAASAGASGPSAAQLNAARLTGSFGLTGTVTDAVGVRSERRGDRVRRTWSFSGSCTAIPCGAVRLTRPRSGGTDSLILRRHGASAYIGTGSFTLPLSCGSRRYARGETVPFTITVIVAAVRPTAAGPVASAVRAGYVSRSRRNLTPCVLPPAHDAAHYTGSLL
jgi:hypothetical protein